MSINNTFEYHGNVRIRKLNTKNKKVLEEFEIKNEGTQSLFTFLCYALIGDFDQGKMPKYIDASTQSKDSKSIESALSYRSLITSKKINKIDSNISALYTATIAKNQLKANSALKSIYLTNSPSSSDMNDSILAKIDLTTEVEIADNQALIIEWDLSFTNTSTTATGE